MIRLSVNLLKKLRLAVPRVHRREDTDVKTLIPSVQSILNIRSGSRLSRIFTHIFSQERIKRLFGANIAAAIVISGFVPTQANLVGAVEQNIVTVAEINTNTEKGVKYPTNGIRITQGYRLFHPGIDFDGITGDPIYPFMNGKVEAVQYSKFAYGNAIIVNHGNGLTSLYAHLSKIFVKVGSEINTKEPIGLMGATGRATGDHLHFEIHENGRAVNPMSILPKTK